MVVVTGNSRAHTLSPHIMLGPLNLAILEFLSATGEEQKCIDFYNELDEKPDFDIEDVRQKYEYKQAIYAGDYNKFKQMLAFTEPQKLVDNPEIETLVNVAILQQMVSQKKPTETILSFSRQTVVPSIESLELTEGREKYLKILNDTMGDFVLKDKVPENDRSKTWEQINKLLGIQHTTASLEALVAETYIE